MNTVNEDVKAKESFRFYTRLQLSELTMLRAYNLEQLLEYLKQIPTSCVYYHTHRFLQQHQYLSPEPPNDFAYWVTEIMGELELGERLASIDTVQFQTIRELRDALASTIEHYLTEHPQDKIRFAHEGDEFHFIKSVNFILPTNYEATTLGEFVEALRKVTIDSIYFHMFESRLRLEKKSNDFSNWIEGSFDAGDLAGRIAQLDPYTYTMEDLRKTLIKIIERRG